MVNRKQLLLGGGLLLVVFGLYLFVLGYGGITQPIQCVSGCPSVFSSMYATNWAEILVGLVCVAFGITMIVVSRRTSETPDMRAGTRVINSSSSE